MSLTNKRIIKELVKVIKESILEDGYITPGDLTEYIELLVDMEEIDNNENEIVKDEILNSILNCKMYLRYIIWKSVS